MKFLVVGQLSHRLQPLRLNQGKKIIKKAKIVKKKNLLDSQLCGCVAIFNFFVHKRKEILSLSLPKKKRKNNNRKK